MNQRRVAFEIIYKTMVDESFTNLLMRKKLSSLQKVKRPFVTNLVMNVLKKYDYLIYQFKDEINSKTSLKNKIILAMAIFEKFYLKEKPYVINNEYVNLADNKYDKAFINALLHKDIELKKSPDEYINHSLPKWLYSLLEKQYDEKEFKLILDNYQRTPEVYYRINKKKASFKDFKEIEIINEDIFTSKVSLIDSDYMKQGLFYIQDINSSMLYKNLDLKKDDTLLDVCCAPGSKLFNCLDIIEEENAYANDLHKHRVTLIKDKAHILGFDKINYLNYDGTVLNQHLDILFDKILLDVPCSGLGTIGRKPDLKYHIKPNSLDELQLIQKALLESNAKLLKKEGILLYSTCTLNKKENRKQIDDFLFNHKEFVLLKDETIINEFGDCFYYGKLQRL